MSSVLFPLSGIALIWAISILLFEGFNWLQTGIWRTIEFRSAWQLMGSEPAFASRHLQNVALAILETAQWIVFLALAAVLAGLALLFDRDNVRFWK
jgi:hypothetical protein